MSNAGAIRAGRAFVEMFIDDSEVQASLQKVQAKLKTFGAAVDTFSAQSFRRMSSTAIASTAAAGTSVGVLAATMGVLRASVDAVGTSFRSVFNSVTTSVFRATLGIGALTTLVAKMAPKSRIGRFLDGFLNKSQTTEALGRWTRFFGALSGSSSLRQLGTRLERLGLGASIIKGFKSGGIIGGLGSTLAASIRSSRSIIASALGSALMSPINAARAAARGIVGGSSASHGSGGSGMAAGIGATATAGRFNIASVAGMRLSGVLRTIFLSASGAAGALAALGTGAAKTFVSAAREMSDQARETGRSLDDLIKERYGKDSLIKPADVEAAAQVAKVMDQAKQAVSSAWAQIGTAALPILKALAEKTIVVARIIERFVVNNRELIGNVIVGASKLAAFGAGFLALTTFLASPLAPLSALGAAIGGLFAMFPQLGPMVMSMASQVGAVLAPFLENFRTAFGTISEMVGLAGQALINGDLPAAMSVLMTGLQVAWLQGTEELRGSFRGFTSSVAGLAINAYTAIRAGWVETCRFFGDAWQIVIDKIGGLWKAFYRTIGKGGLALVTAITGGDVSEAMKSFDEESKARDQMDKQASNSQMSARDKASRDRLEQIRKEGEEMSAAVEQQKTQGDADAAQQLKDLLAEYETIKKELETKFKQGKEPEFRRNMLAMRATQEADLMGTFSASAMNRQQYGGIKTERMERLLGEIAENTKYSSKPRWQGP